MQIREVYPGSPAATEAEYVELQMWASGQSLVDGHVLRSYDAAGNPTGSSAFTRDVGNSANQSTLLLATAQAEAQFGVAADAALAAGSLSPAGGAVCWETIDCVSWGSFSGTLPGSAGSPAVPAGIPDGMALRRSIARGCTTLLDPADDSDNSVEDFAAASPLPRPNSVPPTERTCATGGGSGLGTGTGTGAGNSTGSGSGGGGSPESKSLETFLRRKPAHRTRNRTPTFRFTASDDGASFECKLDRQPYRNCRSPFTSRSLKVGQHRFLVRARSGADVDSSPAAWRFRVLPAVSGFRTLRR
jgi:hypothetical protein